jgi:hypothetical protein
MGIDFASMDTGPVEDYARAIGQVGQALDAWAGLRDRIDGLRPAIGAGPVTAVFLADYTDAAFRIMNAAERVPGGLRDLAESAVAATGMYLAADEAGRAAFDR